MLTASGLTGETLTLQVLKGVPGGEQAEVAYQVPVVTGMVVLDAVHYMQHNLDTDLACRWNCKAAKCGSCSAEVNGRPVLMCKTRVDDLPPGPVTVHRMKSFPLIKDLVTDVSRNYEVNKEIPPFTAAPDDGTPWRIQQQDIDRIYEFRKCIECFLCQDVCHILRSHDYARPLLRSAILRARRVARDASQGHPRSPRADPRARAVSATATSPSAAPRCARSTSTSPTTRSSRSRSGWRTCTGTRCALSDACSSVAAEGLIGVIVLSAVMVVMLGASLWFYFYSRTLAWGQSDTRKALLNMMIVVGPDLRDALQEGAARAAEHLGAGAGRR